MVDPVPKFANPGGIYDEQKALGPRCRRLCAHLRHDMECSGQHLGSGWCGCHLLASGLGSMAMETVMKYILALIMVIAVFWPTAAQAESPVSSIAKSPARPGQRIKSKDGVMLLPLASNVLGSDTYMHLARGSETALDMSAPQGSPVYAACTGKVTKAAGDNAGGYGNNVIVLCKANGIMVWTGHHDKIFVRAGQTVNPQTVIGTVGMTGVTSFSHIHITLRRVVNGKWQRPTIEKFWPMEQFHWSPFASPSGEPWVWSGAVSTGNPKGLSRPGRTSSPLRVHAWWLLAICIVLLLRTDAAAAIVGQRGGKRGALASGMGAGFAAVGVVGCTLILLLTPTTTATASTVTSHTGDFQDAHKFTARWEGWACTEDGHHTMGGVSQPAYNAYRQRKGLRPADVCKSLTKAQAEQIYYEQYWLESGANRLPWPLSAAHYDTAVGSGPGRAREFLQQCTDGNVAQRFVCYQRVRISFYSSMRAWQQPWINRTNDLTKLVTNQ